MKSRVQAIIFLVLLALLEAAGAKTKSNPGHQATPDTRVVVGVFHPSLGTIQALLTLREKGLLPGSSLSFLGLYHEKQRTDYSKAREFVRSRKLDWFSFYPLSGALSEETLFQRNDCSSEFEKIFQKIDGLVFFGGPDIAPSLYQERTLLLTEIVDPYRHFLELSFAFHLLGGYQDEAFSPLLEKCPDFPVLGICLGSQSLNVATGGTLTQDIWWEDYGRQTFEDVINLGKENWHVNPFFRLFPHRGFCSYFLHPIKLSPQGKFCTQFGYTSKDFPLVISEHHQQVKKLGKGFRAIAHSLDGKVVEAIEHTRFRHVLGVQFHPEYPDLYSPEILVRFTPKEKNEESLPSLLAKNSPSADFHKKLWAWVSQTWLSSYQRKHAGKAARVIFYPGHSGSP